MTSANDLKYWVALSRLPQLGAVRFRRLEAYFGELEAAWRADGRQLQAAGLKEGDAAELLAARAGISPDAELAALDKAGFAAVNWHSGRYPLRLKQIADPPPVLYYAGTLEPDADDRSLAVVGTRSPTEYGKRAAAALTRDLAANGLTIVSGLALGIDGIAHRSALEAGGRTIAVLAGGLDRVYPKEHADLFRRIQQQGAIVSEHPPGVRPLSGRFPRRNRLISGITMGTLVVEAGVKSGTRYTVYQALEQNREVFCVPGEIFSPASAFTNRMIQEGAKLVLNCGDILEELNLPATAAAASSDNQTAANGATTPPAASAGQQQKPPAGQQEKMDFQAAAPIIEEVGEEAALLAYLHDEPLHVDELRRQSGLTINAVNGMLALLELQGKVKQVGSLHYVRVPGAEGG